MKEIRSVCLMALWFIKSEAKRAALAKALASGKKSEILKQAKKSLDSVKDPKIRKQLSEVILSSDSKQK